MDADFLKFLEDVDACKSNPDYQACFEAVKSTSIRELEGKYNDPFHEFFIYAHSSEFISELRRDPKKNHWYLLLVNGIQSNVKYSFSCLLYHQKQLESIENNILNIFKQYDLPKIMGRMQTGVGSPSTLDFEYQAYVLSYRRCLDQFARAIAAYFKNACTSFRTLPKFLESKKPQEVAKAISTVHEKYLDAFKFVLSEDRAAPSVRDRIAHYEFVSGGFFNVSSRGVFLLGGGEDLNSHKIEEVSLAQTLDRKTEALYHCIQETLKAFIEAATIWEATERNFVRPL
ncbi:hypothetical protein ABIE16_002012 [Pseudomonas sp. 2725]|uniref:hypothetical protein n=1 Tax=Pseudomonas sp. 2725 TaxID=3156449 RepID=UPI003D1E32C8